MRKVYKFTIIGAVLAAAVAFCAAKGFSADTGNSKENPIEVGTEILKLNDFNARTIRNATIDDEGEAYSGEAYLKQDGTVIHPEWFEGDKLIKADGSYYRIKAKPAPDYSGTEFTDHVDVGDPESESAAKFESVYASEPRTNPDNGGTYRTLSKNGAMVLNFKCSPTAVNYLTVQLWGSDTGDTILWVCDPVSGKMNRDNTNQPHRNDIVDRRDWVELNYNNSTPQYDGGFIYVTYEIPEIYTAGKESVSLRLYSTGGPANYSNVTIKEQTEESRGIYSAFLTQSAAFDPAAHGLFGGGYSGDVENLYAISDSSAMEAQREALKTAVQNGIGALRSWQIYGDDAPSYMQGMITRTDWRGNMPQTEAEWKNRYYNSNYMLKQNLTPLNMLELASYAYKNAAELGLTDGEKAEMLDRAIIGIDFLCRAQGANGGFYSDGWIGGPDRADAVGNNLTGFGLRSAGQAILDIYDELDDAVKNERIDSDADGEADTARIEAWKAMLVKARDYLITLDGGYGHAPNQDMANSIAALRFDAALVKMQGSTLTRGKRGTILDICFGNAKNLATSSYWVSPKGTILENFGSVQGGYSGDYGSAAIVELSQLAELGKKYFNYNYSGYMKNVYSAIDHYYFTGKKTAGDRFVPQQYTEGIISNRNAYYPGTERYPIDLYSALTLKNDTALKILVNHLEQQDLCALLGSGGSLHPTNAHFEDNILDCAYLYKSFDAVVGAAEEREIGSYRFVMEDDSVEEYAWADEMARNVVIKDHGERIYLALNWRNPMYSTTYYNTVYEKDRQSIKANELCRVHATNGIYDRYGYAAMTTDGYSDWTRIADTDGYMQALMTVKYGDYTVIMNSYKKTEKTAAEFEEAAGLDRSVRYKDLISGEICEYSSGQWNLGTNKLTAAESSTLVLKAITLYASEPVIKNGTAYTEITNRTDETEAVTLYAAEYGADGALVNVHTKTVDAKPGVTAISVPAENAQRAFVWNKEMTPMAQK